MRSAVTVVEVGPATIRGGRAVDEDLASAAVEFVDDEVMLVGDAATPLSEVWHGLLSRATGGGPATIVVPSGWGPRRIDVISHAAHRACTEATFCTRAEMLGASGGAVVEIAADVVVVVSDRVTAVPRSSNAVAAEVLRRVGRRAPVLVDAPAGVAGAEPLATSIAGALGAAGVDASVAEPDAVRRRLPTPDPVGPVRRRPRRIALAAGALGATLAAGVAVVAGRPEPPPGAATVLLAEGRLGVAIPVAWPVRRIVQGPGSARLQADSPDGDGLALHITQSPLPHRQTREQIAETLRAALGAESADIFGDFRADDERAGRWAVTYRERRDDVDIEWFVFADDLLRIGVGCQSPRDGADLVRGVCDAAVGSAHALS
ncbi:type VII secretion-associated protein [Mycobacterium sp. WMMD1722]|uniref:type VII secretion-associated protein n=1 Tax=Mycobacterium sp. WMMD1722 TaxID=3404117 RepID=UPI003BF586F5